MKRAILMGLALLVVAAAPLQAGEHPAPSSSGGGTASEHPRKKGCNCAAKWQDTCTCEGEKEEFCDCGSSEHPHAAGEHPHHHEHAGSGTSHEHPHAGGEGAHEHPHAGAEGAHEHPHAGAEGAHEHPHAGAAPSEHPQASGSGAASAPATAASRPEQLTPGSSAARVAFEQLLERMKGRTPLKLDEINGKLSPDVLKLMEKIEELRRRQAAPAAQ